MVSFLHDSHITNTNTDTNALHEMVIASGTQNELISFTVAHGNRARLYSLCTRWKDGLHGQNCSLNGKFFLLEEELILDHGHIMEIDIGVFSIPILVDVYPIEAVISNTHARDPALEMMAGPYAAGDPNTKGVKTSKICPAPHQLAGLWLLGKYGNTWQEFFSTVYPMIMNEGRDATYLALTKFIQQLAVGDPTTINCSNRPAAPPLNAVLLAQYMSDLEDHFPGLRQDTDQQNIQIAGVIGRMVD